MEPILQFWISQFWVRLSHGHGPCKWDSYPISTGLISLLNETELNEQALLKHFTHLPTHPSFFFFFPTTSLTWGNAHLELIQQKSNASISVSLAELTLLHLWTCTHIYAWNGTVCKSLPPIQRWVIDEKMIMKKGAHLSFLWFLFFIYGEGMYVFGKCSVVIMWKWKWRGPGVGPCLTIFDLHQLGLSHKTA